MQAKKKYNIALIGAGRMGARWANVIAKSKRASLSLVVDKDTALGKKVAKMHSAMFSTEHKLALGDAIDAVFIATPHKFLYPRAKDALLAGKHVFVEKPGSRTEKEMRDLLRIARKKQRTVMVGFNYRFFDSLKQAKRIVESGKIGEINSVRIVHGHPGRLGYEKEWRMDKDMAGGGVLMDQGLHMIDLARWFLGDKVERVWGSTNNLTWKAEVEDSAFVILETKRKKIASLSVSVGEWKPVFSLQVNGEKGYISIQGLGRKYGNGDSFLTGIYNRQTEKLEEKAVTCDPDADKALAREFDAFIDAVGGGLFKNRSAEDAAEALHIIETVYAEKKKRV